MVTFGSDIYKKCIWLDKNILYWRVETGLKATFIMYHFLRGPWIVKFTKCFCQVVLLICHNWDLLIAYPRRSLCFKKFKTTTFTAFLISNTVVQKYTIVQLQSSIFRTFILNYRSIWYICLTLIFKYFSNSSWTGISRTSSWSMVSILHWLHHFYF